MQEFIRGTIVDAVGGCRNQTGYRTPLVGFAAASDPGFAELKVAVGPGHLLPQDLLPGARSVAAFFVPFTEDLVRLQRQDPYVNRAWAVAYVETNRLIDVVCGVLAGALAGKGVRAAWQQPTHNFDPVSLASLWSHKHVAYICGLGSFGRHQMLITASGCAGRFGSLVTDAEPPETWCRAQPGRVRRAPGGYPDPCPAGAALQRTVAGPEGEHCLTRRGRSCDACIRRCPSGALTKGGLDKQKCYRYLLEVNDHYQDLGLCEVCGKCATGPCALRIPGVEERDGVEESDGVEERGRS